MKVWDGCDEGNILYKQIKTSNDYKCYDDIDQCF